MIYKSVFIGIDPSPVKSINYIKKNINVWNNIYDKKINFALKYKKFTSKYSNSLTHKNDLLKFTANV